MSLRSDESETPLASPRAAQHPAGGRGDEMPDGGKVDTRNRKRADGTVKESWRIDFYDVGLRGNERYLSSVRGHSFTSFKDADGLRIRICHDVARGMPWSDAVGQWRKPDARPNLFVTFLDRWLDERGKELAPNTLSDYRLIRKNHIQPYWDDVPASEVGTRTVRQWLSWMREKGTGDKATKNALIVIRGAHTYYREEHPEAPVPVWPKVKVASKPKDAMPILDVLAAIDAMKEEQQGIYLGLFWGFLRANEARGVTVGSYDFATHTLTRGEALKTVSGANPDRRENKTGKASKVEAKGELREWLRKYRGDARLDRGAPLFPNPNTGTAYSWKALYSGWVRACKRAGVPYVSVYHALKASVGTDLIEAGIVSRGQLRAAWDHGSETTTAIYLLEQQKQANAAGDALEQRVASIRDSGLNRDSRTEQ